MDRKQKFIELVAQGLEPYRACIEAGYSPKYAKTDSHKLREKYEKEINELKPIAQEAIKEAYRLSDGVKFEGAYRRSDIGQKALQALN